jgi:hypothetical protein
VNEWIIGDAAPRGIEESERPAAGGDRGFRIAPTPVYGWSMPSRN